jgi:hypothetical protein
MMTYKGVGGNAPSFTCTSSLLMDFAAWLRGRLFADLVEPSQTAAAVLPTGAGPVEQQREEREAAAATAERSSSRAQVASVVWASRARHELFAGGRLSQWQRIRHVGNDAEIAKALQAAVLAWNEGAASRAKERSGAGGAVDSLFFEFRELELSDMPWNDQIFALARTAVLVGTHGAGLANQVWMAPGRRSAVVEVMHNVVRQLGGGGAGRTSEEVHC